MPSPITLPLPAGFEDAPKLLALGGELKSSICKIAHGQLTLIPGIGDLEQEGVYRTFADQVEQWIAQNMPSAIITDMHPDYLSTQLGEEICRQYDLPLIRIQHHQAHIAAAMADQKLPISHQPVLGLAMDGLGLGEDGIIRGAELLYGNYHGFERVGAFEPVPMLGGAAAIREPWRSSLAHLLPIWEQVDREFGDLEITRFLREKPIDTLRKMASSQTHAPIASSCGRLFDAVAAILGLHREGITQEAQAAIALEKLATSALNESIIPYPIHIPEKAGSQLSWQTMWPELLADLKQAIPAADIAARFHLTLMHALTAWVSQLQQQLDFDTVVLSGGVFQNRILSGHLPAMLEQKGFRVIRHQHSPCHDGSLALGQIMLATAGR